MLANLADWMFAPSALTPHGFCLLWEPWLIWAHAAANSAIATTYFVIPVLLTIFVRRRADLVLKPVFWLFSGFVLLCGAGHLVDVLTIWLPAYRLANAIDIATALISVATGVTLWVLLPHALALPSHQQMKAAASALQESEDRYRRGFLHAPMPLLLIDLESTIYDVSERCVALLGYPAEELLGSKLYSFQPDETADRPASQARLRELGHLTDMPRRYRRRDGVVLDVLVSCQLHHRPGDAEPIVVTSLVDITARKQAEAALQRLTEELEARVANEVAAREAVSARLGHADRMHALGQLAGGIAHDINNALQSIQDSAALIEDLPTHVESVVDYARLIIGATDRAAGVVRRLLTFARQADLRAEPIDIPDFLRSLQDMMRYTMRPDLSLQFDAEPDLPQLFADRGQLEIVLINLATNARDAMPEGGRLTILATSHSLNPASPGTPGGMGGRRGGGLAAGCYVRLAVSDTGVGMDAATLAHAGEPYFTTKPLGQGTGLGLSMAKGFAEQSGGGFEVTSAPGNGTTVTVWLPQHMPAHGMFHPGLRKKIMSSSAQTPGSPAFSAIGPAAGPNSGGFADRQGTTVLLVDDEPVVRKVLSEQLRRTGYRVLVAACGDDALAFLDAGELFTILVSDLSMPGMSGMALLKRMRMRRPNLPAILLTGYASNEIDPSEHDAPMDSPFSLLRKPVSGKVLLAQIETLLAERLAADEAAAD